jgi:DNA ligase-1
MLLPRSNPSPKFLEYPVALLPKLDGIRCLIVDNKPVSRTLKPIPNKHIREVLTGLPDGLDGELIVGGDPTADNVYSLTNSGVMSVEGTPDFTYWVFDRWDDPYKYSIRMTALRGVMDYLTKKNPRIQFLEYTLAANEQALYDYEEKMVNLGYEGIIIRDLDGLYKWGRCTYREGNAYKYKRFADSEGVVIDVLQEMQNNNEEKRDATGKMQRSISKAGLLPKDSMGALMVETEEWGRFQIGSGFTKEDRQWWWENRTRLIQERTIVKFKYFPVGIKDKPRFPIYLGIRSKDDM